MSKQILVFGSNEAGIHGAGAAKTAYEKHGARWGKSYGHHGNSFAIPTKDEIIETMPLKRIQKYVAGFIAYAQGHPKLTFKVTRIGCGLAKLDYNSMASLFKDAPDNCLFDEQWRQYLGNTKNYWGTF